MKRNHRYAFQAFGINLAKIVQPVVISARDRGGELGIDVFPHHDSQTDGRIQCRDVESLSVHRFELRFGVEPTRAKIRDFFIDARGIVNSTAIRRFVALKNFTVEHHHRRTARRRAENSRPAFS